MALSSKQRRYVETVLAGLPHLAEAVAAIPPDLQPAAFQAAERSFLKAFRQLELSGPQTWASSVMRRLRRRVREAEKEKLTKLYEHLSANEPGSALLLRTSAQFRYRSGSFIRRSKERGKRTLRRRANWTKRTVLVHNKVALSEDQKNVGKELAADEQIDQAHGFGPQKVALSEDQNNVGKELSADEQIDQAHGFGPQQVALSEDQKHVEKEVAADEQIGRALGFVTLEAALSEEQKVAGELSANEQIGEPHGFGPHQAALSEDQKNAAGEVAANEQIGEAHSFATHEAALSEEQKNLVRESVKKDAVALRMAKIMIKVDEIFDDGGGPWLRRFATLKQVEKFRGRSELAIVEQR